MAAADRHSARGRTLAWGGFAGMAAAASIGLSFVTTAATIIAGGGPREPGLAEFLPLYESYRVWLATVTVLLVAAAALAILLFRALHDELRGTALGPVAVALGTAGAVLLAVVQIVLNSTLATVAALYVEAPSATAKETIALSVSAGGAAIEALITTATGTFFGLAMLAAGGAMLEERTFSRRLSWLSLSLGLLVLASVVAAPDPHLVQIFVTVWLVATGASLYRRSRITSGRAAADAHREDG